MYQQPPPVHSPFAPPPPQPSPFAATAGAGGAPQQQQQQQGPPQLPQIDPNAADADAQLARMYAGQKGGGCIATGPQALGYGMSGATRTSYPPREAVGVGGAPQQQQQRAVVAGPTPVLFVHSHDTAHSAPLLAVLREHPPSNMPEPLVVDLFHAHMVDRALAARVGSVDVWVPPQVSQVPALAMTAPDNPDQLVIYLGVEHIEHAFWGSPVVSSQIRRSAELSADGTSLRTIECGIDRDARAQDMQARMAQYNRNLELYQDMGQQRYGGGPDGSGAAGRRPPSSDPTTGGAAAADVMQPLPPPPSPQAQAQAQAQAPVMRTPSLAMSMLQGLGGGMPSMLGAGTSLSPVSLGQR